MAAMVYTISILASLICAYACEVKFYRFIDQILHISLWSIVSSSGAQFHDDTNVNNVLYLEILCDEQFGEKP